MSKIMPVDILSSIKGAKSSEAVDKLFDVIKNAEINQNSSNQNAENAVSIDDLRADVVENSSEITKQIIIENFPKEKDGYLVVSKVIEG
ncbi:Asp-tRNA(Asn)/Glu-tRNA(Gln) amidotransferase C subunit [Wenyingzhuangia heitensis]|uniref:Asp-tRNA(Asn)/Glu-tRNA(Gln) amidotransferase C subunit n=1 Tax=Wenyingzhuangia heitensis TaxID=1487859 RepID=A0ABX0U466_9FLAO|nr:hypothetical protein [Wenyingzhuangia heitensis]NIJ43634.1 Asp-tRNA(Asn)/Glu-tRNA(Gln) amidotransferase C subunit [Wenyingzhuangia heitensis]